MPWGAAVAAGAALIGSSMQADAAEDASRAQQESSREALDEQRRQFDLNRSDLAPWRDAGGAAITTLRDLLGIGGGGGYAGGTYSGGATVNMPTREQFRTAGSGTLQRGKLGRPATDAEPNAIYVFPDGSSGPDEYRIVDTGAPSFDEAGYNAAVAAARSGAGGAQSTSGDPEMAAAIQLRNRDVIASRGYGLTEQELALPENQAQIRDIIASFQTNEDNRKIFEGVKSKTFGNSPLTRKFTVDDFWKDPVTELGLEFGLSEGTKALDRMSGARGMRNSGQALKELTRFGTDYTGTKAAESRNRYVNDQDTIYNRLAGVAGSGQTAATNTASMGTGIAQNIGNIQTAAGNARGAAAIAGGNAWGGAFNRVGDWWNQKQTLDRIYPQGSGASNYNSSGTFQPFYTGYDMSGGAAYG